ncbi:MAG: hypothetical protein OXH15_22830 [Gammaproteobacteria bacterium]|nr:hypothetical protein [Gammaproteobacteria bacterium]
MLHTVLIGAFAALCAIAGASIALALGAPLVLGGLLGIALGSLPMWLPRLAGAPESGRCAEVVGLVLLLGIAATLSASALLPVLADEPVLIEASIPLLLMAPSVYVVYLLLNRREGVLARQASVPDRLSVALSGPPMVLTLALGITVAVGAVLLIHYVGLRVPSWSYVTAKFVDRGIIPPLTLMLFFWGLLLLANKAWVLWREGRLMDRPRQGSESVLLRAHGQAVAGGEITGTNEFLELVWKKSADFYIVPRYINWAIPILGFIGTVLGISLAADGIQNIIGSRSSLSDLSTELGQAIAPLGIAFDTTLIALSLSVFLTLLQTALQRWEDGVLVAYEGRVRAQTPRPGDAPRPGDSP